MGAPEDMTAAAFVKRLNALCKEHGRVKVSREEGEDTVLTITGWSIGDPVRCRVKARG